MLHEVLFALLGHTGSIIIEDQDRFVVNTQLGFLSSAEKDLINKVI